MEYKKMNDIKIILKEEYLISTEKIEKNNESTEGNVFIINTSDEKYVIKIYDDIFHTKEMIDLHLHLLSNHINVPKIIFTQNKESYIELYNNKYIVVYSFVTGKQIYKESNKIDDFVIAKIAKSLRKIHTITEKENKFNLPKIIFDNNDNVKRISTLHFDITGNNILVDENLENKISIIDFDDAKYGPSVYDVSIAITNLFFSKTRGVNLDGALKFINKYYDNEQQLKDIEMPLIKKYALQWIEYTLTNNLNVSTKEGLKTKYKLIEQYL